MIDSMQKNLSRSRSTPSARQAWTMAAMLFVFMLINFADKAVLGLAAVHLMADLGMSPTTYGLISSSFFLLFSVSALSVGLLTNRVSTRWVLFAMAVAWGVAQIPMAAPAAGVTALLVTRILLGAAEGPAYPVANHAAHKWFPDRSRDLVSGVLTIGAPIGVIAAAPLVAWIISDYGWRTAFAALGVVGLVWAAVWLAIGREGPLVDQPTPAALGDEPKTEHSTVTTWRVLSSGTWIAAVAGGFAGYWSMALLVAWVPPYLNQVVGLDAQAASVVTVLPWALISVGLLGQGLLVRALSARGVSTRWTRGVLSGSFVVVAGVSTIAFVMVDVLWLKIALLAIGFSAGTLIVAGAQALCAEISPTTKRGGVLGAFTAVYSLAGVVAPAVTGRLVATSANPAEGYRTSFLLTGVLLLVCGLVVVAFARPAHTRSRLYGAPTGRAVLATEVT